MEVSFPHFLGERQEALLDFVLGEERSFGAATLSQGAAKPRAVNEAVRRARTLDGLGVFESAFVERVVDRLPLALERLGQKEFPLGRVEVQVTASTDGDYFRLHQDGGPDGTRVISFVYFLHREPRRFSGGQLRICRAPADVLVMPEGDTIVYFPVSVPHEVLPVEVPTQAFADSRFTVNGWLHRAV